MSGAGHELASKTEAPKIRLGRKAVKRDKLILGTAMVLSDGRGLRRLCRLGPNERTPRDPADHIFVFMSVVGG